MSGEDQRQQTHIYLETRQSSQGAESQAERAKAIRRPVEPSKEWREPFGLITNPYVSSLPSISSNFLLLV